MPELDISAPHAEYKANIESWLQAWDFYRGGTHVLAPGRAVGQVRFLVQDDSSTGTDSESPRRRARFSTASTQSYLHSHIRESSENYADRKVRAAHYPVYRHLCDLYASATLRTAPMYDGPLGTEPWATYHDNVDLRGTNLAAFNRQALILGLVYGVQYAITDKPRFAEQVASREQQLARGERAYSYLVTPKQLINWSVDEHGRFNWIVIEESGPDVRAPGEAYEAPPTRYRLWTREHWELFEDAGNGKQKRIDGDLHPVGEVPISSIYARRNGSRDAGADAMLADAVHIDKSIFNKMSLIDEQIYGQCFSQLFLPDDGSNQWSGVDIGVGVAVPYNSENGQPLMLSPESSLILAQWQMIADQLQMLKESHGVGRGKAESSKQERSAAALSVESRNENNQVASLAESIEEFDRSLHRHVAMWEGEDPEAAPKASYSRDVSIRSVTAQIQDAVSLQALGLPPEAMAEVVRPLMIQTMNEQGATKESVEKAIKALGDALEKEKAPVEVGLSPEGQPSPPEPQDPADAA